MRDIERWEKQRDDLDHLVRDLAEPLLGGSVTEDAAWMCVQRFADCFPIYNTLWLELDSADESIRGAFVQAFQREATILLPCYRGVREHSLLTHEREFHFFTDRARLLMSCWSYESEESVSDAQRRRTRRRASSSETYLDQLPVPAPEPHWIAEVTSVARRFGSADGLWDVAALCGLGLMLGNAKRSPDEPPFFMTSEPGLKSENESFVPVEGFAALPLALVWRFLRKLRDEDPLRPRLSDCPGRAGRCPTRGKLWNVWSDASRRWQPEKLCATCRADALRNHDAGRRTRQSTLIQKKSAAGTLRFRKGHRPPLG